MVKNTFLFTKCFSCKKQKNEINNNEYFKYCFNCKVNLCNSCIYNHDKKHMLIDINKTKIKCLLHPNNTNKSYCIDCTTHLCQDCLKQRKHIMHKKISIIEIEPTQDEINTLIKLINGYKHKEYASQIEKNNILIELETKYKNQKQAAKEEYNQIIINAKRQMAIELKNSENNYNYEINKIKEKMGTRKKINKR